MTSVMLILIGSFLVFLALTDQAIGFAESVTGMDLQTLVKKYG